MFSFKTRGAGSAALALALAALLPAPAFAASVYDARSLGMGGPSLGLGGSVQQTYWNPAAAAVTGGRTAFLLPSLSVSAANNVVGVSELGGLVTGGTAGLSGILGKLGGGGLNAQIESVVEPFGVQLGQVGPGSMAIRLYGQGLLSASTRMSGGFSSDLNSLFLQGGFDKIASQVAKVSAAGSGSGSGQAQAKADAEALGALLDQNMASFIKQGGGYDTKSLDFNVTSSANAALAATYAQPVPVQLPGFLSEGQWTVGATAKIFGAAGSAVSQALPQASIAVPGAASGAKLNPIGGQVGANVDLNLDKQVTELRNAITAFTADQNLATGANLASKAGAFFNEGLGGSTIAFSATNPASVGAGLDLGSTLKINREWSVAAALANPLVFWPATKSTYTYDFSGSAVAVKEATESVNYWAGAPFTVRAGGAYQPAALGGLTLAGTFEAPFNGLPPSVTLGAEKLFGPLAVRLGTTQFGVAPLYTAGLGVVVPGFQANLAAGADPALRGASVALGLGAGF